MTPILFLGGLASLSLLTFDLYQPALPAMTTYFNTSHALGQITLSLYLFVFGLSQLVWGPLIDHFGRRRTLPVSLILFLIATAGCIFATSIEMLIAWRSVQGFAGCCTHVVSFSATRDCEDSTERARQLSYISMIVSMSPIFAPLIGSIVFIYFGWRATFVLMAIIGIILLILGQLLLRESPQWLKPEFPFLLKTSLKTYQKVLRHRDLWIGIIIISASFAAMMIIVVNAAYLIIDTLHLSPLVFSILFAMNGLMIIIGNYLGIHLRERYSMLWNIRIGCLMMISSGLLMGIIYLIQGFNLLCLSPALLICLGVSMTNPPTLSRVMSDYKQHAATATAIINTVRMSLAAVVAGLIGSVLVYHLPILPISLLCCGLIGLGASYFFLRSVDNSFCEAKI